MNNEQYIIESAKTDEHGNFNYTEENKERMIACMEKYLETMQELDTIKRDIFYTKSNKDYDKSFRSITHGVIGIATESQEVVEAYLKSVKSGENLDAENMREEMGDILWYVACVLRGVASNFAASMAGNIAKLMKRFPDKFSEALARGERDKVEEMKAMSDAEIGLKK